MPKSEHTPGPWSIRWGGGNDNIIDAPNCTGLAVGVGDADAHLIAAAPDMLAALQLVIYRPEGWPNVAPGELVDLAHRTKDAVLAAIAKATAIAEH